MRITLTLLVLLSLSGLTLVGCSESTGDGDSDPTLPDASTPRDTGTEEIDDGPGAEEDAGPGVDAWPEDDVGLPPPRDAAPDPPDPTATERNFRVLHWNIAGGKENDCRADLIARAVVRFARDHAADFVGLNEVCRAQHDEIERQLRVLWSVPAAVQFAAYVGDGGGTGREVGNSIFARLGFVGGSVTREQVGTDRFGNRNLICAQIRTLPHLRFCSTHLTPADDVAGMQLNRVRERIEGWWMDRRDTVILSGDLNLEPNAPPLNSIYSASANTPNNPSNTGHYREVDDDDPGHCRGYGERSLPGTAGGPCMQGGKIDFILVRENRIVSGDYVGDTFNDPNDCTGVCSDHRAVWGRVHMRIAL
jgi:endonuclease/exonuclease/phosphatase family metal-dependent hydrolase